jgi:hypothetical protein
MKSPPYPGAGGDPGEDLGGDLGFFYGGLAAFARVAAPLAPDRLSERLLSALSDPSVRLPPGGSATFSQHPVSIYSGPELYGEVDTVGSSGIEYLQLI